VRHVIDRIVSGIKGRAPIALALLGALLLCLAATVDGGLAALLICIPAWAAEFAIFLLELTPLADNRLVRIVVVLGAGIGTVAACYPLVVLFLRLQYNLYYKIWSAQRASSSLVTEALVPHAIQPSPEAFDQSIAVEEALLSPSEKASAVFACRAGVADLFEDSPPAHDNEETPDSTKPDTCPDLPFNEGRTVDLWDSGTAAAVVSENWPASTTPGGTRQVDGAGRSGHATLPEGVCIAAWDSLEAPVLRAKGTSSVAVPEVVNFYRARGQEILPFPEGIPRRSLSNLKFALVQNQLLEEKLSTDPDVQQVFCVATIFELVGRLTSNKQRHKTIADVWSEALTLAFRGPLYLRRRTRKTIVRIVAALARCDPAFLKGTAWQVLKAFSGSLAPADRLELWTRLELFVFAGRTDGEPERRLERRIRKALCPGEKNVAQADLASRGRRGRRRPSAWGRTTKVLGGTDAGRGDSRASTETENQSAQERIGPAIPEIAPIDSEVARGARAESAFPAEARSHVVSPAGSNDNFAGPLPGAVNPAGRSAQTASPEVGPHGAGQPRLNQTNWKNVWRLEKESDTVSKNLSDGDEHVAEVPPPSQNASVDPILPELLQFIGDREEIAQNNFDEFCRAHGYMTEGVVADVNRLIIDKTGVEEPLLSKNPNGYVTVNTEVLEIFMGTIKEVEECNGA